MRSTQSFEGHSKKMHTRGLSTEQEVLNIILIQGRGKESKMVGGNLLFFKKEIKHLVHPYYDSLVVTLQVANTKVHKIIVDTRSFVEFYSWMFGNKLGLNTLLIP